MQRESKLQIRKRKQELENEIKQTKKTMDSISSVMDKLHKGEHTQKLIRAGKVIEEAGLLDMYDHHNLYLLLKYNSEFICVGFNPSESEKRNEYSNE